MSNHLMETAGLFGRIRASGRFSWFVRNKVRIRLKQNWLGLLFGNPVPQELRCADVTVKLACRFEEACGSGEAS